MVLSNMKMSKDEADEQNGVSPSSSPQYPYGLSLSLDDESLEKLGMLENLPAIGGRVEIRAIATVTSISQNVTGEPDDPKDKEQRVSLQITDMEATQDSAASAGPARMLYGAGGRA